MLFSRVLCILPVAILCSLPMQQATGQETPKVIIQPYGFVKFAAWFDSRQVKGNRDDLMLYYLLNRKFGVDSSDLNARHSINFSAMTNRAGIRMSGPEAIGARATALIEGDCTGACSAMSNTFRLRHAYFILRWDKTEILAGQYWHPMLVPEVFSDL